MLLPVLVFVQLFIFSQVDGGESMPQIIATNISNAAGPSWPLFAPVVGALGSFVAGSGTVSNLIFTSVQYDVAIAAGFSVPLILTLQGLGAAAGNMIALHNVVAAATIAGVDQNRSYEIIKKTIKPLALLLLAYGATGLVVSLL